MVPYLFTWLCIIPVEAVVCVDLTALQREMYERLVHSKAAESLQRADDEKASAGSLSFITQLKKLCNRMHTLPVCMLT